MPDEFGDASGEIIVSSMVGDVTLNKPFQATTVSLAENTPSSPKILDVTLELIDNMLIVSPPKEEEETIQQTKENASLLDFDGLDVELLEDQLDANEENLEFTELDIDLLDVDFLRDLLDVFEEMEKEKERQRQEGPQDDTSFSIAGTAMGFDPGTQISTFIDGSQVILQRQVENTTRLELMAGTSYTIKLDDGGETFNILINNGGDIYISIKQQ